MPCPIDLSGELVPGRSQKPEEPEMQDCLVCCAGIRIPDVDHYLESGGAVP